LCVRERVHVEIIINLFSSPWGEGNVTEIIASLIYCVFFSLLIHYSAFHKGHELTDFVSDARKFMYIDSDAQQMFAEFNPIEMLLPRRMTRITELQQQIQVIEKDLAKAIQMGEDPQVLEIIQQHIMNLHKEIQTVINMPAHDLISLDVKVSMGTRYMSRAQRRSEAVQLHQTPSSTGFGTVIDDQALMEFLEVPGWQEILGRQQAAAAVIATEMEKIQKQVAAEEKAKEAQKNSS